MPFYNGTLFRVDQKEMLRYAGVRPQDEVPQAVVERVQREALVLAEPRGIWQCLPYDKENYTIAGELTLAGNSIHKHLAHSEAVAVLAVTVGDEIEKASDAHFKRGEYFEGLLLDAAATAMTEQIADQVNEVIKREAKKRGEQTTWRFSPGYGDWPVTQQQQFCRLIQAEQIGIHVTDHSMLFPRKSVSAIIGMGSCDQKPAPLKCRACALKTCPFRNK